MHQEALKNTAQAASADLQPVYVTHDENELNEHLAIYTTGTNIC
jgi:hypothetical protein